MKAITILFLLIIACWTIENATIDQLWTGAKVFGVCGLVVCGIWQAVSHE